MSPHVSLQMRWFKIVFATSFELAFINTPTFIHLPFLEFQHSILVLNDPKWVKKNRNQMVYTILFGAMRVMDGIPAVVKTKCVICPLLSQGARKRVAPLAPIEPISAPVAPNGTTGITRVADDPLITLQLPKAALFSINLGAMATGDFIGIAYQSKNQTC